MRFNTFSFVAYDPAEQALGVGVASKFLAVGAAVSWAKAGVGAVATQSFVKIGFGPDGLALLAQGKRASETLAALLADDPKRDQRQVGVVDTFGGAASHTGSECFPWAGHQTGEGYACQGNILAGAHVVDAMVAAFQATGGALEERLLAALLAGDDAGGDRRGKESAALLVVKPNGGYGGDTDRYLDLRVDDHPEPTRELARLVELHRLYLGSPRLEDQLPITPDIARELQAMMRAAGYTNAEPTGIWDAASIQAFWAMVGSENLEARWTPETTPNHIDSVALNFLRQRFGKP